jgi:hypothetical protein
MAATTAPLKNDSPSYAVSALAVSVLFAVDISGRLWHIDEQSTGMPV